MYPLGTPIGATGAEYPIMVLLVDDQPLIGEALRRLLAEEEDIDMHFCSRPLMAIELANQLNPTVILQDLVMPDIDGLDLVTQFRQNPSTVNIPIIVFSTQEHARTKSEAFARGANDYLVKLPDRIELIARIRYHSRAYLNQMQRDEAYRALRESQKQLLQSNTALISLNHALEEANHTISELARYDSLTGLINRRVFDDELKREVHRCARQTKPLTAIMMDIDYFKSINDMFGHAMGDEVLRALGKFLSSQMRPHDIASRYGGEEFIMLLSETSLEEGLAFAERIRLQLSQLDIPNYGRQLTGSFGIATLMPGQDPAMLIDRADAALYKAKQNGRNRVEFFTPLTTEA